MRKTGLCGVVIATLFGTAGLLQHPSHQVPDHHNQQQNTSLAQAGVSLLNSFSNFGSREASSSATLLPYGFLRVMQKPGPTPAQLEAYRKAVAQSRFDQAVAAEQQAQAQAAEQAQAEAAEQAEAAQQAQQEAQQQAAAAAQAAAAQAAAQQAAAAQAAQNNSSSPSGGVWAELRDCESGGDYAEDSGNGYYGAYQFALSTWYGLGLSGLPSNASPAVQDQAAEELQARSGWDQWPACSAELGL
jgi:pyruvate/2-oxoglutarate dehydrogenase complex dihydrolipoamide acyltransferase (E2) component